MLLYALPYSHRLCSLRLSALHHSSSALDHLELYAYAYLTRRLRHILPVRTPVTHTTVVTQRITPVRSGGTTANLRTAPVPLPVRGYTPRDTILRRVTAAAIPVHSYRHTPCRLPLREHSRACASGAYRRDVRYRSLRPATTRDIRSTGTLNCISPTLVEHAAVTPHFVLPW